jgi:hypothetical protein
MVNYKQVIDNIGQVLRMLSSDYGSSEAKRYLALAAASLSNQTRKNDLLSQSRKQMEEAGKKKNEEWIARLAKNTPPPDGI